MHKVSRTLLLAGVLAFGGLTAACDNNGTQVITNPGVQSVTLTPPSATIPAGSTIQLAVSVVADASTAKTVTYTTSSAAVATVDATGKVTGVAAGTATIIATSTADASKAAASVITVTAVTPPQGNTVAISTINQNGPGGSAPANLAAVAGQLDVTLFVTGPAAQLDLIMNCPNSNGGADVVVASQVTNGTQQNQSSVTLSFNTANTGTVVGGVAVPSATSTTPIFLNGNCTLKSKYGTATAANVVPLTLTNASTYRTTIATTGPSAISSLNGFNYQSGDLTATIVPINYVSATPLAFISGTFAGKTFTNVAPATGTQTFTVTFPGGIVAQGTTGGIPTNSISNYTSPVAGDFLNVTASVTTSGQSGFASLAPTGPIRIDNGVPNAPTIAIVQSATSWINGAYTFVGTGKYVSGGDQGSPATGTNADVTVIQYALATTANPSLTGNTLYGIPVGSGIGATQCSTTLAGWTTVTSSAAIPKSPAGSPIQYRARAIETDKIGNVSCTDLGGSVGAPNGPLPGLATGFFGVDPDAPFVAQTAGPTGGSPTATRAQNIAQGLIVTGTLASFNPTDSISGFVLNRQMRYSLSRNFTIANAATTFDCVAIVDGAPPVNPIVVGSTTGTNAGCINAANNAPNIVLDGNEGTQAYYNLTARSVDQANNFSATLTYVFLLDNTAPIVSGISIPQTLAGGAPVTFTSGATDNVDLQASNFNLQYSAATGLNLFYAGDNYGPNYDATIVKTATINATVPFFIKQLQATAAGAPVAFTAADSGKATTINVRAIDAANLVSVASSAAIPNINIAPSAGFTTGTELNTFNVTNAAINISNGSPASAGNPTSTSLTAAAVLLTAGAQSAPLPFSQVCYFYQQSAAGFAADPTIPAGSYVQIGCVSAPIITDVASVSRTWTYTLTGFDPAAALGTAGTVSIIAVGVKTTGVGLASGANTNITLIP